MLIASGSRVNIIFLSALRKKQLSVADVITFIIVLMGFDSLSS